MLGGSIGDAPMLCVGKLMGLLGPWLCFHGVESPSVSFGCPHGGRAYMLGGFVGDACARGRC